MKVGMIYNYFKDRPDMLRKYFSQADREALQATNIFENNKVTY